MKRKIESDLLCLYILNNKLYIYVLNEIIILFKKRINQHD